MGLVFLSVNPTLRRPSMTQNGAPSCEKCPPPCPGSGIEARVSPPPSPPHTVCPLNGSHPRNEKNTGEETGWE
ncbi:hypothetical protein CEXT_733471 [Caerostris extrusa]|uniref:Uncharacterized protein n=1 Tax=Caerostris extrusa TaxID=172846 RepID=A0AAV4NG53_CAEEX|nr:hypothetical protein CEXT_733471 [Caerostris extrusa]